MPIPSSVTSPDNRSLQQRKKPVNGLTGKVRKKTVFYANSSTFFHKISYFQTVIPIIRDSDTLFPQRPEAPSVIAPPSPSGYNMPFGNVPDIRNCHPAPEQDRILMPSCRMQPHLPPVPWGRYRRFLPVSRRRIPAGSARRRSGSCWSHRPSDHWSDPVPRQRQAESGKKGSYDRFPGRSARTSE